MAVFGLPVVIIFLPDLDDKIVGFMVLETDKIELIRICLARMPYLIQIRINSHLPAQDQGIKICLVHAFLDKYRPF